MRTGPFVRTVLALMGLAVLATTFSFSSAAGAATHSKGAVKTSSNKGLCKLVAPSVVATAVSTSMKYPVSLIHGSETQCTYRAKTSVSSAVILRYDTNASVKTFSASQKAFTHHGLTLSSIDGLGDKAFYFSLNAGESTTVTTVVVVKASLQILTTGTGTVDEIGAVARYALNMYEGSHSKS
jgi:hypothetical protein